MREVEVGVGVEGVGEREGIEKRKVGKRKKEGVEGKGKEVEIGIERKGGGEGRGVEGGEEIEVEVILLCQPRGENIESLPKNHFGI